MAQVSTHKLGQARTLIGRSCRRISVVLEGIVAMLAGLDGGQNRFFQRVCQDLAKRGEFTAALARKLEAAIVAKPDNLVRWADASPPSWHASACLTAP